MSVSSVSVASYMSAYTPTSSLDSSPQEARGASPQPPKRHVWPFLLAGFALTILYAANLRYCENSPLQYLDAVFLDSDMHANLLWAKGIAEQGWLNPVPFHPYTTWMQLVAPYPQWLQWWGGEQIYQQSPLYPYLLVLFLHRYFWMRVFQALMSMATCIFLGLFTARVSGRTAGWIAFWLVALYAPFYAYSWPFLRDCLGFFLAAALMWGLSELTSSEWPSTQARRFAWFCGVILGLGFLAKEAYLLLIPVTWAVLAGFAWKRAQPSILFRVVIATLLIISPLIVRNWIVKAPLLSSSNRLAETFIQGNAGTAHPYIAMIPAETGPILQESAGRPSSVIRATIASNRHGVWGWLKLQGRKLMSLLDPYESPDNLSIYFVEYISPIVRFGLRYWMVLPLGLAGLFLSIWRREQTHLWIWIILPVFLIALLVGIPLSRYRQSLMIFFIPLAGYSLALVVAWIKRRQFRLAGCYVVAVLIGWALMLGPFARQPRSQYERNQEYVFSAEILERLGERQQEQAMLDLIRRKFPGLLAPDANGANQVK
jgi:4-amino-4-deoxy-L-arabinose transferase-like glycosyltransferase